MYTLVLSGQPTLASMYRRAFENVTNGYALAFPSSTLHVWSILLGW